MGRKHASPDVRKRPNRLDYTGWAHRLIIGHINNLLTSSPCESPAYVVMDCAVGYLFARHEGWKRHAAGSGVRFDLGAAQRGAHAPRSVLVAHGSGVCGAVGCRRHRRYSGAGRRATSTEFSAPLRIWPAAAWLAIANAKANANANANATSNLICMPRFLGSHGVNSLTKTGVELATGSRQPSPVALEPQAPCRSPETVQKYTSKRRTS